MDYLLAVVDLILIFSALIVHQRKGNESQKRNSANVSFYFGLIFLLALGIGNLLMSNGLPVNITYLESGSILAIVYLGYLYYLLKYQK